MKLDTKLTINAHVKKFGSWLKRIEPKVAKFFVDNSDDIIAIIVKLAKSNFENPVKRATAIKEILGLASGLEIGDSSLGLIVEVVVKILKSCKVI